VTAVRLAGLILLLLSCRSALLEKEKISELNARLEDEVLVARTDILPDFAGPGKEVIFKSGSRIRCWLEASDEWIRVKAIPATENREQARGHTILYIFRKDLELEMKSDKKAARQRVKLEEKAMAYLQTNFSRLTGYTL